MLKKLLYRRFTNCVNIYIYTVECPLIIVRHDISIDFFPSK